MPDHVGHGEGVRVYAMHSGGYLFRKTLSTGGEDGQGRTSQQGFSSEDVTLDVEGYETER